MDTRIFIKHKPAGMPADYLKAEADGLRRLQKCINGLVDCHLKIPEVLTVNETALHLTRIRDHPSTQALMQQLGQGLAILHQSTVDRFGLEEDNYIGLSPQKNGWFDDWGDFFVQQRLGFQINRIRDATIREQFADYLKVYAAFLTKFLNHSQPKPCLVHGDLWAGNVLFDDTDAWLIDPAVYYGDREVDLAMTEMFGGFSVTFYQAYDAVYPRTDDYADKKIIYNLYHYLNHYNLFGDSYLAACYRAFTHIKEMVR